MIGIILLTFKWINVVFEGSVVLGVIQIVFLIRGRKQAVIFLWPKNVGRQEHSP